MSTPSSVQQQPSLPQLQAEATRLTFRSSVTAGVAAMLWWDPVPAPPGPEPLCPCHKPGGPSSPPQGVLGGTREDPKAQEMEVPSGQPQSGGVPRRAPTRLRGRRQEKAGFWVQGQATPHHLPHFLAAGPPALSPALTPPLPQVLLPLCGLRLGRAALPHGRPALRLHPVLHRPGGAPHAPLLQKYTASPL